MHPLKELPPSSDTLPNKGNPSGPKPPCLKKLEIMGFCNFADTVANISDV